VKFDGVIPPDVSSGPASDLSGSGRQTAGATKETVSAVGGPPGDALARMIELRPMIADDLPFVASWLREPHVARWWLPDTTPEAELEELSARLSGIGDQSTRMLTILERGSQARDRASRIGWCQWYPHDAYPTEAEALGAQTGDFGLDYASAIRPPSDADWEPSWSPPSSMRFAAITRAVE
jgi:hypothetical protein